MLEFEIENKREVSNKTTSVLIYKKMDNWNNAYQLISKNINSYLEVFFPKKIVLKRNYSCEDHLGFPVPTFSITSSKKLITHLFDDPDYPNVYYGYLPEIQNEENKFVHHYGFVINVTDVQLEIMIYERGRNTVLTHYIDFNRKLIF